MPDKTYTSSSRTVVQEVQVRATDLRRGDVFRFGRIWLKVDAVEVEPSGSVWVTHADDDEKLFVGKHELVTVQVLVPMMVVTP